ncbi:MAG: hypothetical protein ABIQ16_24170 [Polyangiaceae bacterium]
MLPFAVATLVLGLEVRSTTLDLATTAQGSPRPRECRGAGLVGDGLWSRLRVADAQHYCELLARGYARLHSSPKDAWLAAQAAEALAGPRPAVRVLNGRALLRLEQAGAAFELFQLAEAEDPQAFADPRALHDYGRAASFAGKAEPALRAYRLLASRVALLDDPRERTLCLIEAGAHVLAAGASADEALGYLAQARQQPLGLAAWIAGLRAIAIQRSGRAEPRGAGFSSPSAAALGAVPARRFSDELPLLPVGLFDGMRAALSGVAATATAPPSAVRTGKVQ